MLVEGPDDAADRIAGDHDVGVDEKQDVPLRFAGAKVPGGGGAGILREPEHPHAVVFGGDRPRFVGRGVVDHDDFRFGTGSGDEGCQRFTEVARIVADGHDN